MSYSFAVRAASKSAVLDLVEVELGHVVSQQSVHNKDYEAVVNAAKTFVGMIEVDDSKDVRVSVSGSISGNPSGVRHVSVSIDAALVDKEVAK